MITNKYTQAYAHTHAHAHTQYSRMKFLIVPNFNSVLQGIEKLIYSDFRNVSNSIHSSYLSNNSSDHKTLFHSNMQSLTAYRIKCILLSLGTSNLFTIFVQLYPTMGHPNALYAVATTGSLTLSFPAVLFTRMVTQISLNLLKSY